MIRLAKFIVLVSAALLCGTPVSGRLRGEPRRLAKDENAPEPKRGGELPVALKMPPSPIDRTEEKAKLDKPPPPPIPIAPRAGHRGSSSDGPHDSSFDGGSDDGAKGGGDKTKDNSGKTKGATKETKTKGYKETKGAPKAAAASGDVAVGKQGGGANKIKGDRSGNAASNKDGK